MRLTIRQMPAKHFRKSLASLAGFGTRGSGFRAWFGYRRHSFLRRAAVKIITKISKHMKRATRTLHLKSNSSSSCQRNVSFF